ncbi:hypothetical protein BKA59DRAFT_452722 [Fusarium tricinctum]|uniref:Uncharacterized protein n=1 Tax=Fusarium tricinctum TaxID=61284 RepID=A0A8K0WCY4_9HYPO|nr:hypothetical protein BKA59DRAFT_452722 [Fusarium tricinctum]
MRSQSITLIAALFGAVTAVPCYELGWGGDGLTAALGPLANGIDPFGPQTGDRRWDVVEANDCWVRWQPIRQGQTAKDARVTKTVFEATEGEVRSTMNSYSNAGGNNIQLWLPMRTRSLQYSHMLPAHVEDLDTMDPQMSISDYSRVVVSIILPSAKDKLRKVRASRTGDKKEDESVDRAEEVGIVGLAGTIDRGDWAYTSGTELRLAMFNILYEQRVAYRSNRAWDKEAFAWTLAEKANGDCVVIDFRNFREFVIRLPPAGVR